MQGLCKLLFCRGKLFEVEFELGSRLLFCGQLHQLKFFLDVGCLAVVVARRCPLSELLSFVDPSEGAHSSHFQFNS